MTSQALIAGQVANPKAMRSSMSSTRSARRSTARKATVGQFVALQSAKDHDHSWWLARVTEVAGAPAPTDKNVNGFKFVKGGYYLKVHHYDRLESNVFKQSTLERSVTIDAEGVFHIFGQNQVSHDKEAVVAPQVATRRSGRAGGHASSKAAAAEPQRPNSTRRVKVLDKVAEDMTALANAYLALSPGEVFPRPCCYIALCFDIFFGASRRAQAKTRRRDRPKREQPAPRRARRTLKRYG
jgi:hypothetical protein